MIAIPLGIFQAVKRNTLGDTLVTALAFIPTRCRSSSSALILIQVFALSFPIFGFEASQSTVDLARDRRLARDDPAGR